MFLVRHGATAANLQRPYVLQGNRVDNPLSETGKEQAKCVAEMLSAQPIAAVYCSEMARACETAAVIAARHGLTAKPVGNLQEIDVGKWEGRNWSEIEGNDAEAYRAFIAAPGTTPYHGGESYADVLARAEPVIRDILKRHAGESIVVVAHNVVNRAIVARLMGLDLDLAKNIRQRNCGVNVIDYWADNDHVELVTLNADGHIPETLGA